MHGRSIPLSRPRRLVNDLLYFAASVPSVPVQRLMELRGLVEARAALTDRPSWTAIFAKAFGMVAAEVPALRRTYSKFPWPHLHEYPTSIASVAFERECDGEPAVLMARVKNPGRMRLDKLSRRLRRFATDPIERVPDFRKALRLAGMPRPIRRLVWWLGLNSPIRATNYFGTFGVTVYSALGSESLHPISPLTTTLNYGVIDAVGGVTVRVVYDHRVLDGATIARALARLEAVLTGPIVEELRAMAVAPVRKVA